METTLQPTNDKKPVIFSGMQPSSMLTIGNYFGALQHWVALQHNHDCFFCVVDCHAITLRPVPATLRSLTMELTALYLAAGINPEQSTLFIQSHVPAHAQLAWILGCFTGMGEAQKMTQFKEKSDKHGANVGLFTYPILQAADILIYQADLVPVGHDQKQHLELARNLAERFNHYYSPTFHVPEPFIPEIGAKIMSLAEPLKKMSKSDANSNATIFLHDPPELITKKIKRAVTDSGTEITLSDDRPAIKNLLTLYHLCTGTALPELAEQFSGKGYGDLKSNLAEALVERLRPLQTEYHRLIHDKTHLASLVQQGAEKARNRARKTLNKVYKKIGLWDG